MHRLDRRLILLRGKRERVFDPNQYYFESASRTRVNRQVRTLLRAGVPVQLVTPRWSGVQAFLEDLATDLSFGEPSVRARPLNLSALKGLTVHQSWAWIAAAVAEFSQLTVGDELGDVARGGRTVWQAVSRRGFRAVIADLLDRAEGGRPRALLVHGLEFAHVEAVNDLFDVYAQHIARHPGHRRFNLLFAGSLDAPRFEIDGVRRVELTDYEAAEAVDALVEQTGRMDGELLAGVVDTLGGVPALLAALGTARRGGLQVVAKNSRAMWAELGAVGDEVRSALSIALANETLSARLEALASHEHLPEEDADIALRASGLVRSVPHPRGRHTAIRAPFLSRLVLAG